LTARGREASSNGIGSKKAKNNGLSNRDWMHASVLHKKTDIYRDVSDKDWPAVEGMQQIDNEEEGRQRKGCSQKMEEMSENWALL
jgi:hypothetical protein